MHGTREGAVVPLQMLVAKGRYLGGLRAWVVGCSSMTQSYSNDGPPPMPNVARVRANHNSALWGHASQHMFIEHGSTCVGHSRGW